MPRRLVCPAPGQVAWQEYEPRPLGPTDVRIHNRFGAEKHGTMQAFFQGYANDRGRWDAEARLHRPEGVLWNYPIPLGNMQVGTVEEAGPESGFAPGEEVVAWAAFEEVSVTSEVRRVSRDWRDAVMHDPGEFALGAVRDGNVRLGDRVAVFGLGAIGLATVQLALAAGASVIALDPIPGRREIAASFGARTLDPTVGDAGMAIREATGMAGVDVAIDFSGSLRALQSALRGVAYGGTIVLGAFPAPWPAGLDLGGEAHMNRPRLVFSRACSDPNPDHPRWDWLRIRAAVGDLIDSGALRGAGVVDDPIPFEDLPRAYPEIAARPDLHLKLSVEYPR